MKQNLLTPSRCWLLGSSLSLLALILNNPQVWAQNVVPTYYTDVQPILEKNCVSCHVKDGIAPFVLDDAKEAVVRAERIAQVTQSDYMPPWPPSRDSQPFLNERRLGTASKQILADWAASGARLGTPPKK